jgi:hypothetical protein
MINVSTDKLETATLDAFDHATAAPKDSKRWQRAIARAWAEFQTNPYLDWQDYALLILPHQTKFIRPTAHANAPRTCVAIRAGIVPPYASFSDVLRLRAKVKQDRKAGGNFRRRPLALYPITFNPILRRKESKCSRNIPQSLVSPTSRRANTPVLFTRRPTKAICQQWGVSQQHAVRPGFEVVLRRAA